jgi:hypothetical protein
VDRNSYQRVAAVAVEGLEGFRAWGRHMDSRSPKLRQAKRNLSRPLKESMVPPVRCRTLLPARSAGRVRENCG